MTLECSSSQFMLATRCICYLMSQVLSGLDFCFMYLYDRLVYNTWWKEHPLHLEMVLKHLKEANLKIKHGKCQFYKRNLHFLGHLISEHGIQPLPEKVSPIEKLKEPSNIDELHYFLVLTGCYRKFFPLFANVTKSLNKFLTKDIKFQCLPQCQAAFEHLKKALSKEPIL